MKNYIIIALVLFVLGCTSKSESEKAASKNQTVDTSLTEQVVTMNPEQLQSAGIEIGTPQFENISGTISLQGMIDVPPQSMVSLSFPLGGYLKSTNMLPGMHVKKGQVLAVLEDMQFIQLQQDYLTAKEQFNLAESEFVRQRDLNASKASSDKVFQQAKTTLETQRILTNALAQKLELIGIDPAKLSAEKISKSVSILSPINGFVSKVNVNVGKYTSPTDMLFELVDPKDVHLVLNVFEKDLNSISIGQRVTTYTNSDPDKKYQAEVLLITKSLNEDRMAEVHCHFENYHSSLVPGMFMNGLVSIQSKKSLTVPEDAIVRWENKFFIFTENGSGKFEMVEINPGIVSNGKQQLEAAGINEQTRLVVKQAYSLLTKIKNTEEEG